MTPNDEAERSNDSGPLRVVVDANITLSMFLVRRGDPGQLSPKRRLLGLLPSPAFRWLWHPDILSDYLRGAAALERDARLQKRAIFDRDGFELLLSALQLYPAETVTATALRQARRRIAQAPRARDLDLNDAIYLAVAVDGHAQLLTSQDSDLLSIGTRYEDVHIVDWSGLSQELRRRGLIG